MISRKEFDEMVQRIRARYTISWSNEKKEITLFPIVNRGAIGRCRSCGKKTKRVLVSLNFTDEVIFSIINELMRRSGSICSLDCLYNFIQYRTPEILEEITK